MRIFSQINFKKEMSTPYEINKKIKELCEKYQIHSCELQLDGCKGSWELHPAHRRKRRWYLSHPELLYDMQNWVLACQHCHNRLEFNARLTEQSFIRLRDNNPKFNFSPAPKRVFKSDFQTPHSCINCHQTTSFLICPYCKEISIIIK